MVSVKDLGELRGGLGRGPRTEIIRRHQWQNWNSRPSRVEAHECIEFARDQSRGELCRGFGGGDGEFRVRLFRPSHERARYCATCQVRKSTAHSASAAISPMRAARRHVSTGRHAMISAAPQAVAVSKIGHTGQSRRSGAYGQISTTKRYTAVEATVTGVRLRRRTTPARARQAGVPRQTKRSAKRRSPRQTKSAGSRTPAGSSRPLSVRSRCPRCAARP